MFKTNQIHLHHWSDITQLELCYSFQFQKEIYRDCLRRSVSCVPSDDKSFRSQNSFSPTQLSKIQSLFAGHLKELPPIPSTIIRIFLSSTFSG